MEPVILAIFGLLIGMTLLKLYVEIQVGHAIGWELTFGLMVLDAIIGSMLMRSQGRSVWARFRETLAAGRPPAREVLDGALVIAGGAFLITPGFVTDIVGGLLLIPPTRGVARRWIVRHFTGRLLGPVGGAWAGRRAGTYPRRASTAPFDVEGHAVEIDHEELER